MKRYAVVIEEQVTVLMHVNAESEEEACEIAEDRWCEDGTEAEGYQGQDVNERESEADEITEERERPAAPHLQGRASLRPQGIEARGDPTSSTHQGDSMKSGLPTFRTYGNYSSGNYGRARARFRCRPAARLVLLLDARGLPARRSRAACSRERLEADDRQALERHRRRQQGRADSGRAIRARTGRGVQGVGDRVKRAHDLRNGPWQGERLYLESDGDGCTGWVYVNGQPGRYRRGRWEPAKDAPPARQERPR